MSVLFLYKPRVANHVTASTLLLTYEEQYRKTKNLCIVIHHLNPIQTFTSYVIKMVINVILPLYLRHTGSTLTSGFPTNIFYACIISATHVRPTGHVRLIPLD